MMRNIYLNGMINKDARGVSLGIFAGLMSGIMIVGALALTS